MGSSDTFDGGFQVSSPARRRERKPVVPSEVFATLVFIFTELMFFARHWTWPPRS